MSVLDVPLIACEYNGLATLVPQGNSAKFELPLRVIFLRGVRAEGVEGVERG